MRFFKLTTLLGFFSLASALNANENYNIGYKINNWKNAQDQKILANTEVEQPQQKPQTAISRWNRAKVETYTTPTTTATTPPANTAQKSQVVYTKTPKSQPSQPATTAKKSLPSKKTQYVQQQEQPPAKKSSNRAFSRLKNKNQEKPQTIYSQMRQNSEPAQAQAVAQNPKQPQSIFSRIKATQIKEPAYVAEATPAPTPQPAAPSTPIFAKGTDQPARSGLLSSSKGSQDNTIDTASGEDEAPKSRAFSRKRYKNRYNIADAAIEKEKMQQRLEKRRAAEKKAAEKNNKVADATPASTPTTTPAPTSNRATPITIPTSTPTNNLDNMNQQQIQKDLQNQKQQQRAIPQNANPPSTSQKTSSIYPKVFPQRYTSSSGETVWTESPNTTNANAKQVEESNTDARFQNNNNEPFYNPLSSLLNVPALHQAQGKQHRSGTEIAESDESHPSAYYPKEKKSIAKIISENPNLSTFASALEAAGIDLQIQAEGPFTIFAPSNEAFNHLPKGAMERLMKSENVKQLYTIIAYHVVPGKVLSKDIRTSTLKTLNGKNLNIDAARGNLTVDDAEVVRADIPASNGVLYIIDEVVLPN